MTTPEARAKDKIKRVIERVCKERNLPFKLDWHAGSAFSNTLDATGAIAGHPVVIEVKRFDENESPTARQKMNMREFRQAGAAVFDIVDLTSLAYFELWLQTVEPRTAYMP